MRDNTKIGSTIRTSKSAVDLTTVSFFLILCTGTHNQQRSGVGPESWGAAGRWFGLCNLAVLCVLPASITNSNTLAEMIHSKHVPSTSIHNNNESTTPDPQNAAGYGIAWPNQKQAYG